MTETHALFGPVAGFMTKPGMVHTTCFPSCCNIQHSTPPSYFSPNLNDTFLSFPWFTGQITARLICACVRSYDVSGVYVSPILALLLPLQMASCVYLFKLLSEGTLCGKKLLSTFRIDEGKIRVLSGLV